MIIRHSLFVAVSLIVAVPAVAGPVQITNKVMGEHRVAAADGTTRIDLVPATRVTPGDKLIYQISYSNNGTQPVSDFVVSNPIPKGLAYLAPAAGSPAPDLSLDGTTFGSLANLRVRGPNGAFRAADTSDVKAVRWRLTQPLAAGSHGQLAYEAMLK